jgi:hypothetical protein
MKTMKRGLLKRNELRELMWHWQRNLDRGIDEYNTLELWRKISDTIETNSMFDETTRREMRINLIEETEKKIKREREREERIEKEYQKQYKAGLIEVDDLPF